MSGPRRLGALGAAASALALLAAGSAPAAHTFPKLLVHDRVGSVTIEIAHGDLDDPAAELTIYVPRGYTPSLKHPAGTRIGRAHVLVTAPDVGLAQIVLDGVVEARDATATYASGDGRVPLMAAAEACTGAAEHAGFWVVAIRGAGQSLELPLFVDPAAPPASDFAVATIRACLPPPDLPAGTPGRAPLGLELARAVLRLDRVLTSSGTGERRWRLTETEYAPGTGVANAADTAETQSLVYVDRGVTLGRPVLRIDDGVVTLHLSATSAIDGAAEPEYRLFRGARPGALRPGAALRWSGRLLRGTLAVRQTAKAQTLYVEARGTVEALGLGLSACRATFRALGTPCVYATRPGFTRRSAVLAVAIPPRR
jgi:hypothetical protein